MYTPQRYTFADKEEILNFIKTYSFATIVTVKDNFQSATHLPFTITERGDDLVLTSHFAKANPQWEELKENDVLVIFTEPHAYISPKHYESKLSVPTWNYLAVHAYGKSEIITDQQKAFACLEDMINVYEQEYKLHWDDLPLDYKTKMLNGIVAFEIVVTDLQTKKKLSQNKKEIERERIINALEKSNDTTEKTIADYMKKL
jgi:transcriptional regulator